MCGIFGYVTNKKEALKQGRHPQIGPSADQRPVGGPAVAVALVSYERDERV